MNKLKIVILVIVTTLFVVGCHRDRVADECRTFDFGVVTYPSTPFVGILKSHPSILEKSLDVAPYKWCVQHHTYGKERVFRFNFNTGAYVDSAKAKVFFCDNKGSLYPDSVMQVLMNGVDQKGFSSLDARNSLQNITIGLIPNPELGDTTITGRIAVCSDKLDAINTHQVVSNPSILDKWTIKQKSECFFWLYFLWILTALLLLLILLILIAIIVVILYYGLPYVLDFLDWLWQIIRSIFSFIWKLIVVIITIPLRPFKRKKKDDKKKDDKKKTDDTKKKKDDKKKDEESPINEMPSIMLVTNFVYTDGKGNKKRDQIAQESLERYLDPTSQYEGYFRMYRNIECIFKGMEMKDEEKHSFWTNPMIKLHPYNITPMLNNQKPNNKNYEESISDFKAHVDEFNPDYIVILGKGLNHKLKNLEVLSDYQGEVLNTDSPSFPFFNRSYWHIYMASNSKEPLEHYYRQNNEDVDE